MHFINVQEQSSAPFVFVFIVVTLWTVADTSLIRKLELSVLL